MKFKRTSILFFLAFQMIGNSLLAQYWQQSVEYTIDVKLDTANHQFSGSEILVYTNNSPDTLTRAYYHLYFNAFQPNSMMDMASRNIMDPDKRVGDRISKLTPQEEGWTTVQSLTQNGKPCQFKIVETILEVQLADAILPGQSCTFAMDFESQVPLQVRRSGRDNAEGIDYSMSQWYPKLCAYDWDGWHPNPYVGREFYGEWGDFNVNITLPGNYIVAATGNLVNPSDVGQSIDGDRGLYTTTEESKTWNFKAQNVHDFVWAADPDYTHLRRMTADGTELNYYYQKNEKTIENWDKLHSFMDASLQYMNSHYGKYPYSTYAFIQGGDGGMEYPMATLITGERSLESLVGVSIHEWMHSWYQMILATDEAQYPWMDEGFTSFASAEVTNHLREIKMLPGDVQANPIANTILNYVEFTKSGYEEPLTTHSDHYTTNYAYGVASYVKGSTYLKQLEYIIGKQALDRVLLRYFDSWKFKHPTPAAFLRIAEKESGLVLDWYNEYFVNTTKTINYAIDTLIKGDSRKQSIIQLSNKGLMPMPVDVLITYKDGTRQLINIPLAIMRGSKPAEGDYANYSVAEAWPWTNPTYEILLDTKTKNIESIELDPLHRVADIDPVDNLYPKVITLEVREEKIKD